MHKIVDGKKVELSPEEEVKILGEREENKANKALQKKEEENECKCKIEKLKADGLSNDSIKILCPCLEKHLT